MVSTELRSDASKMISLSLVRNMAVGVLLAGIALLFLPYIPQLLNKEDSVAAAAASGLMPFGGEVVTVHPNICGGMVHVVIKSVFGGTTDLMLTGATKVYLNGPPATPKQNVLGLYGPSMTCSPTRFLSYSGGVVFMIGTSKPPGAPEAAPPKVSTPATSGSGGGTAL